MAGAENESLYIHVLVENEQSNRGGGGGGGGKTVGLALIRHAILILTPPNTLLPAPRFIHISIHHLVAPGVPPAVSPRALPTLLSLTPCPPLFPHPIVSSATRITIKQTKI